MARRMPKRDPRTGRFLKASSPAPARKRKASRKAGGTPKRRSYRRNPTTPDVVAMLRDGGITAVQILIGKAAARSIPDLLGLPRNGTTGLAAQAATAVAAGYLASTMVGPAAGAAILAGGMTAPLEQVIIQENVPWLGQALSPTLSGYVEPRGVGAFRRPKLLRGYSRAPANAWSSAGVTA